MYKLRGCAKTPYHLYTYHYLLHVISRPFHKIIIDAIVKSFLTKKIIYYIINSSENSRRVFFNKNNSCEMLSSKPYIHYIHDLYVNVNNNIYHSVPPYDIFLLILLSSIICARNNNPI